MKFASWRDKVDLPIPGSPESSMRDHGTIHHHKTEFSSSDFVIILSSFRLEFSSLDKLFFSHFVFFVVLCTKHCI